MTKKRIPRKVKKGIKRFITKTLSKEFKRKDLRIILFNKTTKKIRYVFTNHKTNETR